MYKVGIITASDKGYKGEREDLSGPLIKEICEGEGYEVIPVVILPDEELELILGMVNLADVKGCQLILTTGGTGFSSRDVTPEATKSICTKDVPGIPEAIRAYSMTITKRAMLSRAYSGIYKSTLIINLPGSPKAVKESLEYILDTVKHGLDILCANDSECAR